MEIRLDDYDFLIVSLSGGKDSAYMLAWLVEEWGRQRVIAHHQVIPLHWPGTIGYCQQLCDDLGVELVAEQGTYRAFRRADGLVGMRREGSVRVYSDKEILAPSPGLAVGPLSYARERAFPVSLKYRWCMTLFKRRTLDNWIRCNRAILGPNVLVAIGSRELESWKRVGLPSLAPRVDMTVGGMKCWDWKPLLGKRRVDCFGGLLERGLPIHPAYFQQGLTLEEMVRDEEGGPRIGCRFCVYAQDREVAMQARMPGNWELCQRILDFERETGLNWRVMKSVGAVIRERGIGGYSLGNAP